MKSFITSPGRPPKPAEALVNVNLGWAVEQQDGVSGVAFGLRQQQEVILRSFLL